MNLIFFFLFFFLILIAIIFLKLMIRWLHFGEFLDSFKILMLFDFHWFNTNIFI